MSYGSAGAFSGYSPQSRDRKRVGYQGVLDSLGLTARACWSLRLLRAAYTGPLIRIRRSSDNAEMDFSPIATGLLDSAAIVAWVGAGNSGFVRTWYDQSGNGWHGQQTMNTSQPFVVSAGAWLGEVRSTASGGGLDLSFSIMSGATAASYVCNFAQLTDGGSAGGPLHLSADIQATHTPWTDQSCYDGFCSTVRQQFVSYGVAGATIIHSAIQNGTALAVWRNGVAKGSYARTFTDSFTRAILAPGVFSGGSLRELHLFASALSAPDRVALENNLIATWGVT